MSNLKDLTRREFSVQSVLAMLSGVAITVSACDGDNGNPMAPSPSEGDAVGQVSLNHGHTAIIMEAQLMAGNAVSLNIRGNADHPHTVELTADEVQQIADGARLVKQSTVDQVHSHQVTFN